MNKKDEYIIFINNEYFVKTILTFEEDFHGIKAIGMDIETSKNEKGDIKNGSTFSKQISSSNV